MQDEIRKAIETVLTELGVTAKFNFVVEHPSDMSRGDYATNVAMVLYKGISGQMKSSGVQVTTLNLMYYKEGVPRSLREFADLLAEKLKDKIPHVVAVTVAGPGFINFTLSRDFFREKITGILENPETWGHNNTQSGEEVIFEYTSPNLFKPLHVGNLVGNIIGESMTRLFEYAGATLHRVNYPSDIGLTVAKGVWGLQKTGNDPDDILQIGEAYRVGNDAYENDTDAKAEIEAVNRALYADTDNTLSELRTRGLTTSKKRLDELMTMLGTRFDAVIYESEAGELGKRIVEEHTGSVFEKSEGAVVFKGEKVGLHTRVFINSQGLPTYEAKDVGNFSRKREMYPDWSQVCVVTGNEQGDYFKVLIAALKEVFTDAYERHIEHIVTGFLTLTTGKMSSRKGNVLTGESLLMEMREEARKKAEESRAENVDDLTEMVAVAALKYQILRQAPGTNIVFDKEKALSFEGDSGPYLQYTHARIMSVLEKAQGVGVTPKTENIPDAPYPIERIMYRFPEVVEAALRERAPHKVAVYLTELAGAFNTFYGKEVIADASDTNAPYKAAIADAVRTTLKNGLWVLGIKAPQKM